MISLNLRRNHIDILKLYKIINNLIDYPDLLSRVFFNVPSRTLRQHPTFHLPKADNNYTKFTPIYRMQTLANDCLLNFDLFNCSIRDLKKFLIEGAY